jgi:type IV pilus assembly protein PilX
MSKLQYRSRKHRSTQQRGVVLIMSLIMLVLMTLIGMAGIRAISKEERMVAQSYDRTLAFQASESALREAEVLIEAAGRPSPVVNTACALTGAPSQVMVCGASPTPTISRWDDAAFASWTDATPVGTASLALTPQYFVEYLGGNFPCKLNSTLAENCKRYRISARPNAGSGRSSVVLQTIYATYEP